MNPKKIVRKVLPASGIRAAEESYRKGRVYSLQARYGFPAKGLKLIAITGTNGKTTTASILNAILKHATHKTALLTTATMELNGVETPNTSHRTVLLTADLLKFFKRAKEAGSEYVLFEATSQALHQHKLIGLPIELAVMTNLTQDHLDYHKTMEAYAAAKARLFNGYLKPKQSLLNADDEWFDYFRGQVKGPVQTYGQEKTADFRMTDVASTAQGTTFKLGSMDISSPFIGKFNTYNVAAAAAAAQLLGVPETKIQAALTTFASVPGRMERVQAGQKFGVVVDYAHTPDALQNVLQTLQDITKGSVAVVFGATGDRDAAKRPLMGEVAAKYADKIYLTDDETYTEDSATIIQAVEQGVVAAGGKKKLAVVPDRKEAIARAFEEAKSDDTVLLAGIGHQDYRNQGGKQLPWNEAEVAKELLSTEA